MIDAPLYGAHIAMHHVCWLQGSMHQLEGDLKKEPKIIDYSKKPIFSASYQ
jgi:hypothetical protein